MNNLTLAGFSTSEWRGKPFLQCRHCAFDTFDYTRMTLHQRRVHPDAPVPPELATPLEEWVIQERQLHRFRKFRESPPKVLLGITTWNSKEASVPAARALLMERDRLRAMGGNAHICWVDNNSVDGTAQAVDQEFRNTGTHCIAVPWNSGQSHSRNLIADYAKEWGADFILFVDGDVEVIPYSSYAMTLYLLGMGGVSVIGFSPYSYSTGPGALVTESCRQIYDWMIYKKEYTTCLTQFGLFRRSLFDCCRFEETGPFLGAGWGAEDDEFYIQMVTQGYTMRRIEYHNYIHRGAHTSVGRLGADAVMANFDARRKFIREKWRGVPEAQPYVNHIMATDIRGFSKAMEKQVAQTSQPVLS